MSVERIASRRNPLLQRVKRLLTSRRYRMEEGLYAADGGKLLGEALRWGAPVRIVVASDGYALPPLPELARAIHVPPDVMKSLSLMKSPQGVLFVCALPEPAPLDVSRGCLALDAVQDPGNVGTILRTADAFSIPVVLCEGCADPYSPKAVQASMGAVFRTVPQRASCAELAAECERRRVPLIAAALGKGAADVRTTELRGAAVAVGSEGRGVGPLLLSSAARRVRIPMSPRCESLNAAVAAGILLWQMACGG